MRRVRRLALAAEQLGDLGREPAERLGLGVDHVPVRARSRAVWRSRSSSRPGTVPAATRRGELARCTTIAWLRAQATCYRLPACARYSTTSGGCCARATRLRSPPSSTRAAPPRARSGRGWRVSARAARWWARSRGGCVESDVALRAEEVLAGGPPLLLQLRHLRRRRVRRRPALRRRDRGVRRSRVDPEELDRVEAALSRRRAAVGDDDARRRGRRRTRRTAAGEAHSTAVRDRRDHLRRALRARAGDDDLRRRRHRPGPVPDGEAGRLPHDRLGRARQVRNPRAAARRRRDRRRLARDGLRPARRPTRPPTSSC